MASSELHSELHSGVPPLSVTVVRTCPHERSGTLDGWALDPYTPARGGPIPLLDFSFRWFHD